MATAAFNDSKVLVKSSYIPLYLINVCARVRGHSITTWTRWGGEGGQKMSVFVHAKGIKNCPRRGGGQKVAKFCPRSCWMHPMQIAYSITVEMIEWMLKIMICRETKALSIMLLVSEKERKKEKCIWRSHAIQALVNKFFPIFLSFDLHKKLHKNANHTKNCNSY